MMVTFSIVTSKDSFVSLSFNYFKYVDFALQISITLHRFMDTKQKLK